VFIVKAHEFEWAFGFGQVENISPDGSEQENSPGDRLSPPVTTSSKGGDRNNHLKTTLSPLSPPVTTKFLCMYERA
jgi:hypothetical protein